MLLVAIRDRLQRQHPNDHIAIIDCQYLTAHLRLGCDHVLQFLEGRPHRGALQFYF
jgi:hypothetical protein